MALTVASVTPLEGLVRQRAARITLDSSYATGGEAITAGALGLQEIHFAVISGGDDGYVVQWSKSALKFLAYINGTATATSVVVADTAPLSQASSATDLSAVTFDVLVIGI